MRRSRTSTWPGALPDINLSTSPSRRRTSGLTIAGYDIRPDRPTEGRVNHEHTDHPVVEQTVVERMRAKASFTALDISNAPETDRYPIRHGEVAGVVRDIYQSARWTSMTFAAT